MPVDKLRNQQRSATVALKIRKTKAETLKHSTSWVKDILSDDINRQLAGTSQVRKLIDMSMTKHGPGSQLSYLVDIRRSFLVREVKSFVSRFIKFLSNKDSWQLQVEAAWAITEIYHDELGPWIIAPFVEPIFQKLYTNQESLEVVVAGILSHHTLPQSIATKQF
uniref:Importin subunit alpha-1a-like isoform X2 n=1 Tax=Nicotiana sylvestris TaxID=4096 RepID=A0A1U7XWC5_NICSY|nr:PREDICTED: importin subunit alpha-1a-like isoform X2 [Nicotiana sylvestris]